MSEMRAAGLKKLLSPEIMAVGVFVNSPIEDIVRIASRGIIDAVSSMEIWMALRQHGMQRI